MRSAIVGDVRRDEPMARHTTMRVGGPADLFVTCDTLADLREAQRICADEGLEWTVIGKGSNLLVGDAGYRGVVLALGREFKSHRVDGDRIKAGAACVLAYLVQDAFARGLGGLEFAVGIPGTLGGALVMNAGTRDVWMDTVVETATVLDGTGQLVRIRGHEVGWEYRRSDLPDRGTIVEAVLRLEAADRDVMRAEMQRSLDRRKASQPIGAPSAGSVFKNPEGDSAGRLIEAAGLKGMREGGARVSDVHANFIVNEGGATAHDVARLMAAIQTAIRETHGIELRPEIRFLGTFD
jgi:UDP-N-acetylmuramate dehydrogenase